MPFFATPTALDRDSLLAPPFLPRDKKISRVHDRGGENSKQPDYHHTHARQREREKKMEQSTSNPNLLASAPELTPLETEVLEEYERLAENMKKVRSIRSLGMPSFFLVLLRGEEGLFSSF